MVAVDNVKTGVRISLRWSYQEPIPVGECLFRIHFEAEPRRMLKFIRNEGVGRVYEAEIDQGALGVVTGMQVKLRVDYEYVALGALYYDGVELARPTRPWQHIVAYDGEYGNIPAFHGDMSKYSFGPATSEETVLYWHKFIEEDGKTLLICDRNIVRSISWNHLNGAGFIFGKELELDGQLYRCRVLTGGLKNRNGKPVSSWAGGQLPNEWDRYVMNGADVGEPHFADAPIPVPDDYPNTAGTYEDQTAWARPHNQAWNWIAMRSWCQETSYSDRVRRGYNGARFWGTNAPTNASDTLGWRPVLELL